VRVPDAADPAAVFQHAWMAMAGTGAAVAIIAATLGRRAPAVRPVPEPIAA
jgi:hypothetical protein